MNCKRFNVPNVKHSTSSTLRYLAFYFLCLLVLILCGAFWCWRLDLNKPKLTKPKAILRPIKTNQDQRTILSRREQNINKAVLSLISLHTEYKVPMHSSSSSSVSSGMKSQSRHQPAQIPMQALPIQVIQAVQTHSNCKQSSNGTLPPTGQKVSSSNLLANDSKHPVEDVKQSFIISPSPSSSTSSFTSVTRSDQHAPPAKSSMKCSIQGISPDSKGNDQQRLVEMLVNRDELAQSHDTQTSHSRFTNVSCLWSPSGCNTLTYGRISKSQLAILQMVFRKQEVVLG